MIMRNKRIKQQPMQFILLLFLIYIIFDQIKEISCKCDIRCQVCSMDGICTQCQLNYNYNDELQSCQSICKNNTYMDDNSQFCVSICPPSYYNDNILLSCVKYPDCPMLKEKGQNHFDYIRNVGVTKNIIFMAGDKSDDPNIAKSLKTYTRDTVELSGQLIEHDYPIVGLFTDTYKGVDELFTYSATELIIWDIQMGQKVRKGLFDQNLKASSISYIDQDLMILQQNDQTLGVLKLDNLRDATKNIVSSVYSNSNINTIKGFTRYNNKIYSYSQDGKLYSYEIDKLSNTQLLCQLDNPIERVYIFSEKSMAIRFGRKEIAYYNGVACVMSSLGHDNIIDKIQCDKDPNQNLFYIFTFDSNSFKYSYVDENNSIKLLDFRSIKKSFSKLMKSYLITIDAYGQIVLYSYYNKILNEAVTYNLAFSSYFAIVDVYIGLSSNQMFIVGSELLYLTLNFQKADNYKINLESRTKNIAVSMVKHQNKVNGVLIDKWFNRVVTYSDDGSIIFYDQLSESYKMVMQKYYPSTDCNMLENVRCFKAVNDLQILRSNLYAAIYSDASIIIWKYSSLSFDMIKTLTLVDRSIPILNIYYNGGSLLVYCNGKEVRVYNLDTDMTVLTYAPQDALKNNFYHCATDNDGTEDYLIATRIRDANFMNLFAVKFSILSPSSEVVLPTDNVYLARRDFYLAQYFTSIKWYLVTNSNLQLVFAIFPTFATTKFVVSQNLPVSVAFDDATKDFTCFSRNQFVTFFKYSSGTTSSSYTRQNTYQFASVVYGKQSTVISTPQLFFYFQNTGVSTIQNQVFAIKANLNFQLVLTFEDKISSLNVDTIAKKIYVGFENGKIYSGFYIEDYMLYSSAINYNSFLYNDSNDLLFAYKKDINIIDTTFLTVKSSLTDAAMLSDLNGTIFLEDIKQLIAFNSDVSKNLVKWNIQNNSNIQFMNGHTTGVVDVQVDYQKTYIISQGVDLLMIVWNYIDVTEVYRITEHVDAKAQLDIKEAGVPAEYKTVYKIILFQVDQTNKVIISANNIGDIFVHNYNIRSYYKAQLTEMTNVYVDIPYKHIIGASANNFVYKLTIFSYTQESLIFFKDVSNLHNDIIKGVLLQNDNVYSFEETKIVVMERSTLYQKNIIVCVNPLITNFIVYEKFNQVIIWSDAQTSILNQSIGIYKLDTGEKIIDINNNQIIEQGNIHKVIVDEDTNQLIISKSYAKNFIYTIDLKTFYYSGYYTTEYKGFLKKWQFIPRTNRLIYIDSGTPSNLMVYNMEASINQRNNFEVITDERNKNYYMNEDSKNIYYMDALNQSWQLNLNTDKLTFKNLYTQVKSSKKIGDFFYMVTADKALKFTKDFLQLGEYAIKAYQVYFTTLYLYITDFNNSIIQLELSSLRQLAFQRQLEGSIKQFQVVEKYQEAIVLLDNSKLYRFGMLNGETIQQYPSVLNLSQIVLDEKNPLIIHVISPSTINVYEHVKEKADYMKNLLQTININYVPQKFCFDQDQGSLLILSTIGQVPVVQIYSYQIISNVLQPMILMNTIPSPSRSARQTILLTDANTISITLPWQIIVYDRKTYKFISYNRDTQIIYSRISLKTVDSFPNLLNSVQSDGTQLYSAVNNIFSQPSLYKFTFSYPVILKYSLVQYSIYYQIQIIGISSSFIFSYLFQIPIPQIGDSSTFDSCYYQINGIYNYNMEMQMTILSNSILKLNFQLKKSLIEVYAENSFFYHKLLKTYNSNVIYSNRKQTRATIKMNQNIFQRLEQDQIVLDNYIIDISQGGVIQLNSNTQRVIFKSLQIIGDSKDFSFTFINLVSVILEDILISNLTLSGQSILFQITSCQNVLIKNMRIRNLNLFDQSNLIQIKDVSNNLNIDGLNIKFLFIQSKIITSSSSYAIILMNVVNGQLKNSKIYQVSSSQGGQSSQKIIYYLISSQGVESFIIDSLIYSYSLGCAFLESKNYYRENQQIVYLHSDSLNLMNGQFAAHYQLNSPFISIEGNTIDISHSDFFNVECLSCDGSVISLISIFTKFLLQDSNFSHSLGQQGGAIAFLNNQYTDLTVQDSSFFNCTATASGGAIFISSSNLKLYRTQITQCKAQIGGGIRYIGIEPEFITVRSKRQLNQCEDDQLTNNNDEYNLNNFDEINKKHNNSNQTNSKLRQLLDNVDSIGNSITQNTASIYGENIGSYPKTIKVISTDNLSKESYFPDDDTDKYNLDLYKLENFQSGAEINFEFQILDQEENPIFFDLDLFNQNYYPSMIVDEIIQFNIKTLPGNDNIKVFGQYITDYFQFNQNTKTFSIKQMLIIGEPTSTNFILFETPSIQKIITTASSTKKEFNPGPFHIRLNIVFRPCKRGEVYKLSGSIFYCQECKEGTYSIIQPTKEDYDNQLCLRCPDEASYCYRDQMELKSGYWKYSNDTDQIVYCSNKPENCEGTQLTQYCIEGHIGPQCETCDIYGNLWHQEYQSDGKLGCINCTELRQPRYLLPTIFIAVGIIAYILISIRIASQISMLIVQGYYLRQLNLLSINKSAYQDTTNMNMKAMVNYMQISSMINTFVVQLPEFMTFVPKYFGSPVENMLYTFDCYLNQASESKYPIIFLRTLWSFCIPFFYLIGVGLIYFILVKLKCVKYNQSYIMSGLVFVSFFTQPNMVSNLLGVMSCREIDGKLYISSDISFECYTNIHLTYIGIVCLPGLILWGALIPFYIIRLLIRNKDKLDHALIRLKYGFLYQDFKNNRYYWEFIKMYKKLFAVAILNFYGNPYKRKQYNEINEVKLLGGSRSQSFQQNPLNNQSFQPSKRNRMRMQNNSSNNLKLPTNSNSGQNQSVPQVAKDAHNLGLLDEFSQRNIISNNQLLSADRQDINNNNIIHYLSPKGSSNNLLFSAKRDESQSQRGQYGNYLDIEDIMLSPNRNNNTNIPNSPNLSVMNLNEQNFNVDQDEQEDERRILKKKSTNYDYRQFQKTDLIKKNLQPAFNQHKDKIKLENNLIQEVDEKNTETVDNPDIHESQAFSPTKIFARNTNTLAPRIRLNKDDNSLELGRTMSNQAVKLEPKEKNDEEQLMDLNESDDDNNKIRERVSTKQQIQIRNDNLNNNENIVEKDEEIEDERRIHAKQLINHNTSLQKKANMIYKNLVKIQSSNSNISNNSQQSFQQQLLKQQETENILDTEEDSKKDIVHKELSNNPERNSKNNNISPYLSSKTKHIVSNNMFLDQELIDPDILSGQRDDEQYYNTNLMKNYSSQQEDAIDENNSQQRQYFYQQESDLNTSNQIRDLINNNAAIQKYISANNDEKSNLNSSQ